MSSNVIPFPTPDSAEVQAAKAYGYTVHTGGTDDFDQELAGKWWWCLSKPGWIDVVTDMDEHASEAEAWACAVQHHKAELSLDAKETHD
jgi:hypothetical protein